tara:strand:- start:17107 stop:18006 length:900 start_codon:yes stop_codon:yes gene_type:complete
MAHYAKISNEEFTVSERARLQEARSEKSAIIASNMATDEYATLQEVYTNSFTSETLQTLESEMDVLKSEDTLFMTDEEKSAHQTAVNNKQSEIDAEKAALVPGQETALADLTAKQQEGTEALTTEIETLNTTISNSLARVTAVYTGADEIEMVSGDPPVEKDNTVYWEGYIGSAKRTSYNTREGVHQLGGTPFRKNYAGRGMIYDPVRDAFYGEQPYASWILNEDTCVWEPPITKPEGIWYWKEDTTEWVDYYWQPPIDEQPYPSWIYDGTKWVAPIESPTPYNEFQWNEDEQQWEPRF